MISANGEHTRITGTGTPLGFDGKVLEDAFIEKNGNPIPNNSTYHVTYDEDVLADIHRRMIDKMFHLISLPQGRKMDVRTRGEYMRMSSSLLLVHAMSASLFFKHKAYKNEQEFRFLQLYRADVVPPDIRRRFRAYELVKYRQFDWRAVDAGALRQIVVGPAADFSKAGRFAEDCLAAFNPAKMAA
jgi:hypothetical protein